MPRLLTRPLLLAEIDAEYARLCALIQQVPKSSWSDSNVNSAQWTLKDVLAHLADWAERCHAWCLAGLKGQAPSPPGDGYSWRETRELNRAIYLKRRRHALARVLRDFHAAHAALVHLARTLPDDDLFQFRRFSWTGPSWAVAHHIRASTAAHDRWASKHFRAHLRLLAPPRPVVRPRRRV